MKNLMCRDFGDSTPSADSDDGKLLCVSSSPACGYSDGFRAAFQNWRDLKAMSDRVVDVLSSPRHWFRARDICVCRTRCRADGPTPADRAKPEGVRESYYSGASRVSRPQLTWATLSAVPSLASDPLMPCQRAFFSAVGPFSRPGGCAVSVTCLHERPFSTKNGYYRSRRAIPRSSPTGARTRLGPASTAPGRYLTRAPPTVQLNPPRRHWAFHRRDASSG